MQARFGMLAAPSEDPMADPSIKLSQIEKTVTVAKLTSEDSLLFELLDNTPASERAEMLNSVLHIGALAMLEDRIHHLIDATEKEIFPKLENFKRMFEKRKMTFETTTQKGEQAEVDMVDVLNQYIEQQGWQDYAQSSGTVRGALPRNKTGDILCAIEMSPNKEEGETRLAIEVKLDKSVDLGDPGQTDVFKGGDSKSGGLKKSNFDTAWSQLLETRANRECPVSLMVFDKQLAHPSVLKHTEDIAFLPGIPGFVVIVDSQAGDYRNLFIAYRVARELALYAPRDEDTIDVKLLEVMVGRIVHALTSAKKVQDLVHKHAKAAIKLDKDVTKEMARLVHHAEFTQQYLQKFLRDRTLSAQDLTEFYYAADAKAAWKADQSLLDDLIKQAQQ